MEQNRIMTPLCRLANKYQTDKGGWDCLLHKDHMSDTCHNYTPIYYEMFAAREQTVKNVLEIGVNSGASLRMWAEHFPNAQVLGLDNNPQCLFNEGRIRCAEADQSSRPSLVWPAVQHLKVVDYGVSDGFDLIVDDGSHLPEHQILSANALLCYLAPGGYYVIEDIALDCQPEVLTNHIELLPNYALSVRHAGIGIGEARCDPNCDRCHGQTGENLICYHRLV